MKDLHSGGVVILDFGSQYTQLIARRIRELSVYSEILPHNAAPDTILEKHPKALILSGGPSSVYIRNAPDIDPAVLDLDLPILGICYGLHLLVRHAGGVVQNGVAGEYGIAQIEIDDPDPLFTGVPEGSPVWMSHRDHVTALPPGWKRLAHSSNNLIAAIGHTRDRRYATQFHPEVAHTVDGAVILSNFLFRIAGCAGRWTPANFIEDQIVRIREQVGRDTVICGVSGGVDSSVVAALLHQAVGKQVKAVLIDHGLLRKGEGSQCLEALQGGLGIDVRCFDEQDRFLKRLHGVQDPEQKRKIIGEQFIRTFEEIARSLGGVRFLAQGTLYPDVIESGLSLKGPSAVIKTHHNVGGLPAKMDLELVEPLRDLFKDDVRRVGRELELPDTLVNRHPFPGPGLAVRIIGVVTGERLEMLREADSIYLDLLREAGLYDDIWQAFSVLIPVKTVGVMGDSRTYENLLGLRAVTSTDGMTADWYRMPGEVLSRIANRIVNSVPGINRVVYDITSKPPGTIEWE